MLTRATRILSALLFFLALAPDAALAGLSVTLSYARGEADSAVYELNAQYQFEPILSFKGFTLAPQARLGGFYWDNSKSSLRGAHASLGLNLEARASGAFRPYLLLSAGPSHTSGRYYNGWDMGGRMLFRCSAGLGAKFGKDLRHSLSLDWAHYSNAYLYDHNHGFNSGGLSYTFYF